MLLELLLLLLLPRLRIPDAGSVLLSAAIAWFAVQRSFQALERRDERLAATALVFSTSYAFTSVTLAIRFDDSVEPSLHAETKTFSHR
jgi:hypothetical protein